MTKLEALKALAEKVEAGEWDHSPSGCSRVVFPYRSASIDDLGLTASGAFNGSLDAAKLLHKAVLPGWDIQINTYEDDTFEASVSHPRKVKTYDGVSPCMARAWLLAILKALIAREEAAC